MLWDWDLLGSAMLAALVDLACFALAGLDCARSVLSSPTEHCFGGNGLLALRLGRLCHFE